MKNLLACALLVGLLALVGTAYASRKHHYNQGDKIDFYVNNVGPYSNPTETYEYYSLPFCKPTKHTDQDGSLIRKKQRMGEVIQGDRAVLSDYELTFKGTYICLACVSFICLLLLCENTHCNI